MAKCSISQKYSMKNATKRQIASHVRDLRSSFQLTTFSAAVATSR